MSACLGLKIGQLTKPDLVKDCASQCSSGSATDGFCRRKNTTKADFQVGTRRTILPKIRQTVLREATQKSLPYCPSLDSTYSSKCLCHLHTIDPCIVKSAQRWHTRTTQSTPGDRVVGDRYLKLVDHDCQQETTTMMINQSIGSFSATI